MTWKMKYVLFIFYSRLDTFKAVWKSSFNFLMEEFLYLTVFLKIEWLFTYIIWWQIEDSIPFLLVKSDQSVNYICTN